MWEPRCGHSRRNISACSVRLLIVPDAVDTWNCLVNEKSEARRKHSIRSLRKGELLTWPKSSKSSNCYRNRQRTGKTLPDRGKGSLENPAQYPLDLHQGIHRRGVPRQSHQLSDQLESHFRPRDGTG